MDHRLASTRRRMPPRRTSTKPGGPSGRLGHPPSEEHGGPDELPAGERAEPGNNGPLRGEST